MTTQRADNVAAPKNKFFSMFTFVQRFPFVIIIKANTCITKPVTKIPVLES